MAHEHEELIEVMKGSRRVSFNKIIMEQQLTLDKIKKMSGRKPDKVDLAFIEKHQAKMEDTFNLMSHWISEAYPDTEEERLRKYLSPIELLQHYEITVLVTRRIDKDQ